MSSVDAATFGEARPTRAAVVIPAKDEAERIEKTVAASLTIRGVDLVVVVDDGSSDATAALAKGAGAVVVRHRSNRGKAAAMATGARVVHMREETEHAEQRNEGGEPSPIEKSARALLFIDADMQESASGAQLLVDAVLEGNVDMAIAILPAQEGAAGMGLVVKTARNGIRKATGFETVQPLSGTRCITRETWDAVQPLADGWGVETGLTIDALHKGFWVKEIPAELTHRATGKDLRSQLHRASQLKDVMRALSKRRSLSPNDPLGEEGPVRALTGERPEAPEIVEKPPVKHFAVPSIEKNAQVRVSEESVEPVDEPREEPEH
ncbi:glycosyltransferase [Dermabacter vaginalis]|uniref:glycosyltransferase n=1 Tax=Dermabacter vaginalis TaxID=1630135 RepID=UPI001EF5306F|nr:glycosyltransferase [Dermabacter vaginalis]MCG7443942.1 glycosyltransferase [Dermabacter vaginalis]